MFYRECVFLIFISFMSIPSVYAQPEGQWEILPTTPSKRTEIAVNMLDNKVYVIGGFTYKGIADDVEGLGF